LRHFAEWILELIESVSVCDVFNMEGVGKRMRSALEARGFSEAAIASRIGIAKSTFNHYLNDRSEPKFETLLSFCEIVGIDVAHIIKREDDSPLNMKLEPANNEFVKIDVYDVELAAGDGRIASGEEPVDQLAFRSAWLDRAGINPAHASIVRVSGDSMEPTLADGGVVMIDHRDTMVISKAYIFAVRQGDDLSVKRVERDAENKVIMLHSDNSAVPTKVIDTTKQGEFQIIGRVVWSARTWPA